MAQQFRRVVTGHDATGRAVVTIDEVATNQVSARPGATACVVWTTQGFPVDNNGDEDQGLRKTGTTLDNGTVFRILELAPDIKTICPHSVIAIGPQKYNELYAKIKNLNRLLAWGHAKALENLLERVSCERAISDQFGDERLILNALQQKGRKIVLEQRTKAESDLAVAAASILARAEFLIRLKRLSDEVGTTLPKGASPAVELAGKMVVKKHGQERLRGVAKLHFKTTKAVLGETMN